MTSLLAWWMVLPSLYTLSKVVTPDGAGIPERFMPSKYRMHVDEVGEWYAHTAFSNLASYKKEIHREVDRLENSFISKTSELHEEDNGGGDSGNGRNVDRILSAQGDDSNSSSNNDANQKLGTTE